MVSDGDTDMWHCNATWHWLTQGTWHVAFLIFFFKILKKKFKNFKKIN